MVDEETDETIKYKCNPLQQQSGNCALGVAPRGTLTFSALMLLMPYWMSGCLFIGCMFLMTGVVVSHAMSFVFKDASLKRKKKTPRMHPQHLTWSEV